ncbi:nucleotide-sugar transporter-domain-containing protein [Lasiosphaeria hispida]|uniref:Nucleotide-sugar transporter-domain-containing protein n=1 Tax=Lasiosphaeria hispida TaxID=260671 RepID=A0AAJ0MGZ3_9PEZI|nr:nucleotide-sugar transporter-domain-containing protein [Lasiosphaeria hispida]
MMLGDAKKHGKHGDLQRPDTGNWVRVWGNWRHGQLPVQRLSLILLVLQNSVLVMVMHHSRNSPAGQQPRYLASTAVLLVEVIKLVASLILATYDTCKSHPSSSPSEIAVLVRRAVFASDSWKLIVPAALYTLQNSLVYAAISNLDAVTFQVTYQLKILTTVLFSILLLGTHISARQWLSLILLTCGVALVQVTGPLGSETWKDKLTSLIQGDVALLAPASSAARGLVAVIAAALISGLTCVYFEKLVKDSLGSVSLWTRNVQLSFFSLFPALFIGVLWQDGTAVARDGFFSGYNSFVWLTIALQAFGGLIVAVCIVYAGNVAKNFAASLSIVLSYVVTAVIFMAPMTMPATGGAAIVLLAMYMYHSCPPPKRVLLPMSKERQLYEKPQRPLLYQPYVSGQCYQLPP